MAPQMRYARGVTPTAVAAATPGEFVMPAIDGVVELRRYTLYPGARETLIELFENELIDPQEEVGMHVIGQFRDLDEADHFVWLRGFRDMESRDRGLRAFYGGPVWERYKDAANATMINSDNVFLLRPAEADLALSPRPDEPGSRAPDRGLVQVTTYFLSDDAAVDEFVLFFRTEVAPILISGGVGIRGVYRTELSPNTFPALPVRNTESVVVTVCGFPSLAESDRSEAYLAASDEWETQLVPAMRRRLSGIPHTARLVPTERSKLRQ